ncbi:MAG: cysteine desulfurase family protein [Brevundimonas sp.]|uniref:cysteine desulfurase family protein n=1 Tax=Brevundimonas sp. TaxID=1871086 RepID=UPI00403351DD
MSQGAQNTVYLDNNASAPLRHEALQVMATVLAEVGNPSSIHAAGRKARARVEMARGQVAALVGASAQDVTFTGSGTEANALAIHSAIAAGFRRLIVSPTEHPSVLETVRATGLPIEWLEVEEDGLVVVDEIGERLQSGDPALVVVQFANSETGVVQTVPEVAEVCRRFGAWLHVDAVQAVGRMPTDVRGMGDTWALSAHKLGGPQGVGAVVNITGRTLTPDLRGGGQERGMRAGTENVAAVAGFGAAAETALNDFDAIARQQPWRDAALARMEAIGAEAIGPGAWILPNVLSAAVEDWPSSMQVMALDLAGVMVSAGSACSSGKVAKSPVLEAMGQSRLAGGVIRASGGWATTEADWVRFADVWTEAYGAWRARRQERAA